MGSYLHHISQAQQQTDRRSAEASDVCDAATVDRAAPIGCALLSRPSISNLPPILHSAIRRGEAAKFRSRPCARVQQKARKRVGGVRRGAEAPLALSYRQGPRNE